MPPPSCSPPTCWEALACLGQTCMSHPDAGRFFEARGGWRAALLESNGTNVGDKVQNCLRCNATALARSASNSHEVWNVSGGVDTLEDLQVAIRLSQVATPLQQPAASVTTREPRKKKLGEVPVLLPQQALNFKKFRRYPPKHKLPVVFPCSSSRGEDAASLHTFFTDWETREPLRGGAFLEIGGVNGFTESNTWIYEVCLGWQGVLVEGQPRYFSSMKRNRPRTLNLRMAACKEDGRVNYTISRATTAGVVSTSGATYSAAAKMSRRRSVQVECGNLGERLRLLGVHRLDLASIDVEGSETVVVNSLNISGLSLGVLLVEVREDGQRPALLQHLLQRGMRYVGQLSARGTTVNRVIDDCYVNLTHLQRFFPRSWALRDAASGSAIRIA